MRTRREFIRETAFVAFAVSGCGNDVEAPPTIRASINDDPKSPFYGQIAVDTARYPGFVVGQALTVLLDPLPPGNRPFGAPDGGVLLIHRAAEGDPQRFAAVSAICPHRACPLGYSAEDQLVECPCHGSRFRAVADPAIPASCAGDLLHPPAQSNLMSWRVWEGAGGLVFIDLMSPACAPPLPAVSGGKLMLPVSQYPSLGMIGGSLVGSPDGLADTLLIVRAAAATFATVSATCTHLACLVAWRVDQHLLECPCHRSRFGLDGSVEMGPAIRPLKTYPTVFDGKTVVISTW